jgi:hypothetical protein
MKSLILSLLFLSNLHAQTIDPLCDGENEKLMPEFRLPNCLQKDFIRRDTTQNICKECGINFARIYTETIPYVSTNELQKRFLIAALEDYKKTLASNLLEGIKLGVLPNANLKLSLASKNCSFKSENDLLKGCGPVALKLIKSSNLLSSLNKEVSNELGKILSRDPDFSPEPTLLTRSKEKGCGIAERDALFLSSYTLEEVFSPELIKAVGQLDEKKYKDLTQLMVADEFSENYDGEINQLNNLIKSHPYLRKAFESPKSAIAFFKSIPPPFDTNALREKLYSETYSKSFDAQLAKNCKESFEALNKTLCSNEFERGEINLDPARNSLRVMGENIAPSENKFSLSESDLKKNLNVLRYCPKDPLSNELNLTKASGALTSGLEEEYRPITLQEFKTQKYLDEIGNNSSLLCQMTDSCDDKLLSCKMFKNRNKIKTENTLESKLASSTNKEVIDLLRSMVGSETQSFDPKTKEVLIANGIIPKEDGSFVKQPEVAERAPDYFATAPSTPAPLRESTLAQASMKAASRGPAADGRNDGYSNQTDSTPPNSMSDLSDNSGDNSEIREIQNEIRRRLTGLPKSSPPSKEEAQKIVREVSAAKKTSLSPEEESQLVGQMMAPAPAAAPATTLSQLQRELASGTKALDPVTPVARTAGADASQRRQNLQLQEALMGMAGAQEVSKEEIIKNAAAKEVKELTKVALNIAEDPRVTLADIFNNKLTQNDSETQMLKVLLRNRNNFVLQVKAMNFKIQFDEKQNFNVLLESGDRAQAERIRPQLEMFLKKLRT